MFSKIYVAFLAISVTVMAFLTYYAWSWLQSIGSPAAAVAEFQRYSTLATTVLWISTAILLVVANAILWAGRAWAIWTTFLFFALFVVVVFFGLEFAYVDFQTRNFPAGSGVLKGPVIGVVFIILMATIAFFDQYIVSRLRDKTTAGSAAEEPTSGESASRSADPE